MQAAGRTRQPCLVAAEGRVLWHAALGRACGATCPRPPLTRADAPSCAARCPPAVLVFAQQQKRLRGRAGRSRNVVFSQERGRYVKPIFPKGRWVGGWVRGCWHVLEIRCRRAAAPGLPARPPALPVMPCSRPPTRLLALAPSRCQARCGVWRWTPRCARPRRTSAGAGRGRRLRAALPAGFTSTRTTFGAGPGCTAQLEVLHFTSLHFTSLHFTSLHNSTSTVVALRLAPAAAPAGIRWADSPACACPWRPAPPLQRQAPGAQVALPRPVCGGCLGLHGPQPHGGSQGGGALVRGL